MPSEEIAIRRGPLRAGLVIAVGTAAAMLIAAGFAVALGQGDDATPADRALAGVEDDPGSRRASLVGESAESVVEAGLASDGVGYVDGRELPALTDGRTYQLWGVSGDLVISLGVLGPEPDLWVFEAVEPVEALALTDEESPGVVSSSLSERSAVVSGELS